MNADEKPGLISSRLLRSIFSPIPPLKTADPEVEYVITLVPGTFAKKQKWYLDGGALPRFLRARLPGAKVDYCKWSGNNSILDRAAAADQLRQQLAKQVENPKFAKAKHIVVAHSHGGNVALAALSDARLAARISGVACLGTPFLSARFCPLDAVITRGGAAFMAALYFMVFTGLALYRYRSMDAVNSAAYAIAAAAGIGILLWLGGKLSDAMQARARDLLQKMPETKLSREKLLVVRTPGDEAAVVLALARFVSRTISRAWRLGSYWLWRFSEKLLPVCDPVAWLQPLRRGASALNRAVFNPQPATPPLGGGIGSLYAGGRDPFRKNTPSLAENIAGPISSLLKQWQLWIFLLPSALTAVGHFVSNPVVQVSFLLAILLLALPAAIALTLTFGALPVAGLVSLWLAPLGWEIPRAGPYLDVIAEPAPPGTWLVTQMPPKGAESDFSGSRAGALSHTKAHSDERVHTLLVQWAESLPAKPLAEATSSGGTSR